MASTICSSAGRSGNQADCLFSRATRRSVPRLNPRLPLTAWPRTSAPVSSTPTATAIDYDHDGKRDLVVVGEWMPVRVFHQENGKLVDRTKEAGFAGTNSWWNSVEAADLRGNGRQDLVLGNLGLNSYLRASVKQPARLYVNDFSHSGGGNPEQIPNFTQTGR